jgi:transcriptional regulator of acetoin/glycerol metabolism
VGGRRDKHSVSMAGNSDDPRTKTVEESSLHGDATEVKIPGLVVIFSEGRPKCQPIRIDGKPVEIGRVPGENVIVVVDDRVSRRHTRVSARDGTVRITDLESRNGTFVDGKRITDETRVMLPRVLRVGQTLLAFVSDLRPFLRGGVQTYHDSVIGPRLREAHERIARAALGGDTLLLTGPSGSGKELGARAFHAAAGRTDGKFIAVNCATIPAGLAERLLFGTRKGTYSGADADADGFIQAADRGTLFLDEVAELDVNVQPKLLRVLEMREVTALGAALPHKVDVKIVAATLKDLRGEVTAGRFREDLYYRIGRPEVRLPALTDRIEEIPWLAYDEVKRVDDKLTVSSMFLEACLLRPWPGNVRELLGELRQAARSALDAGRTLVEAKDLSESAGQDIGMSVDPTLSYGGPSMHGSGEITRETRDIEGVLRREQGNVTRAARALGMHRNQLRRWLARHNLDPKIYGAGEGED